MGQRIARATDGRGLKMPFYIIIIALGFCLAGIGYWLFIKSRYLIAKGVIFVFCFIGCALGLWSYSLVHTEDRFLPAFLFYIVWLPIVVLFFVGSLIGWISNKRGGKK